MTARTTTEPWWVPEQRTHKAAKLATHLQQSGFSADAVAHFTEDQRRHAEAAAGIHKGSNATWQQAIDMLAGSAQTHARCPFCGLGDPEGIDGPPKEFGHGGPCSR